MNAMRKTLKEKTGIKQKKTNLVLTTRWRRFYSSNRRRVCIQLMTLTKNAQNNIYT